MSDDLVARLEADAAMNLEMPSVSHLQKTGSLEIDAAARIRELEAERDALRARIDMLLFDRDANREISRGQARRIRELLSRLGEPCAPDIGLPPDEVGPLRVEISSLRADADRWRWWRAHAGGHDFQHSPENADAWADRNMKAATIDAALGERT